MHRILLLVDTTCQSPITASHVDPLSGTTDLTEEVVRATDFASQGGSYADIFLGYYQSDSRPRTKVAIKIIRTHIYKDSDKDKLLKVVNSCIAHLLLLN